MKPMINQYKLSMAQLTKKKQNAKRVTKPSYKVIAGKADPLLCMMYYLRFIKAVAKATKHI